MNIFRLFWNMMIYMIGWGVLGGAGLGAVYGMAMGVWILADLERGSIWNALPGILISSIIYGAPFGAMFGGIAGGMIGVANGFAAGILTRMIFSLSRNWGWYCLSVGAASVGVALVGGTVIFSLFIRPYSLGDFILHAGIPALVAAVVFGHASQRAAKRHLAAVTASRPYYPVV
jgi:uncharacterized membrane protein